MKKYWPVLSLVVVSLLGLSIYYISMAKAHNFQHDFAFETLAGDEALLQNLLFETTYEENNDYQTYFVTNEETVVMDHTYGYYDDNFKMLQLFNEHKSFFRAKNFSSRHLYSDAQSIAYVYVEDEHNFEVPTEVKYNVALYNKETKKQQQYELFAEVEARYLWQTVEWVSYQNETLKTLSIRKQDHKSDAVILTTFDLQNETLTEEVLVESTDHLSVTFNHHVNAYNDNEYAFFTQYKHSDDGQYMHMQSYIFDTNNNELKTLTIPNELQDANMHIEGKYIVAYDYDDMKVNISLYNLETNTWQQSVVAELALAPLHDGVNVQLIGDKLYVLYQVEEGFVIDIRSLTGDVLYSGLMTVTNSDAQHDVYIHYVYEQ